MTTLNSIDWGNDSAEKDDNLLEYFVSSESFQRLAEKRKSFVVGRKGSGKSALLKRLENHFKEQDDTIVIRVTPKYNTIRTILNDDVLRDNFGEEVFFQHTWLRQLYIDFLSRTGHDAKGSYADGSMEFARGISHELGTTSKDLSENITDVLSKVRLKCGNLGEIGLGLEKELRESANLDSLQHHVVELSKSGISFVALIDDLDLGWDNSDLANNLLLGLLSATTFLQSLEVKIHPFVFLREDVYTILLSTTQHSDKYRDIERIRWTKDHLVELLEARINYNRVIDGESALKDDALYSVFPQTIGAANVDNWLVEKTLNRPRELIQLSRYYTEGLDQEEPSDKKLKQAEPEYSSWKLDDLCAEYSNQYPNLSSITTHWKTKFFRRKYHLKRDELDEMVLEILAEVSIDVPWFNKIVKDTDIEALLKVLFEIGFIGDFVLGGAGGSATYYSYQWFHEPLFDEIQIHPCFRKAVKTVERIR